MKIIVSGLPRSGSTMLARAMCGMSPGEFWPSDRVDLAKVYCPFHYREELAENFDRAIFPFGDVVLSVISTRFFRYGIKHFRGCGCDRPKEEIDIFERDDLNYELIFESWTQKNGFPVLAVRYELIWDYTTFISDFVGRKIILPEKIARKTSLAMISKEDLAKIKNTYASLINKVESMPDIMVMQ